MIDSKISEVKTVEVESGVGGGELTEEQARDAVENFFRGTGCGYLPEEVEVLTVGPAVRDLVSGDNPHPATKPSIWAVQVRVTWRWFA